MLQTIENLVKQKDVLGLKGGGGGESSERLAITCLVKESDTSSKVKENKKKL